MGRAGADLLVLNSGMTLSYGYYGHEWDRYIPRLLAFLKARELGVPYGIYGHSFDRVDPPADILYRDVLGGAAFVYTRDSESLALLKFQLEQKGLCGRTMLPPLTDHVEGQ